MEKQRSASVNQQMKDKQKPLRIALQENALFSAISGVIILAANRTLVAFLGLPHDASLIMLGIGLLGYAAWLQWNARRERIKIADAWIAVLLDVGDRELCALIRGKI